MKNYCWCKRTNILSFHLREVLRAVKTLETETQNGGCQGLGEVEMELLLNGMEDQDEESLGNMW